jgi:hypothetical protein
MKVFLGGTRNGSTWRESLIPFLKIDYFNPVVEDWTPECQAEEIEQRKTCDFVLYTITPKMLGVYAVAEVVDDSNKRPEKTILVLSVTDDEMSFTPGQWKSLRAVAEMVRKNGAKVFYSLAEAAKEMNSYKTA